MSMIEPFLYTLRITDLDDDDTPFYLLIRLISTSSNMMILMDISVMYIFRVVPKVDAQQISDKKSW